jgi:suppressor of G2 allele of SKP1
LSQVSRRRAILIGPTQFTYTNGEKCLVLEPLKGQITTDASDYTVGKVKVEVRFKKTVLGRWGGLIGDSPDRKSPRSDPRII